MKKKYTFSSANLCFLSFWLALCDSYFFSFFFDSNNFKLASILGIIFSNLFFLGKYRLLVNVKQKECGEKYTNVYRRRTTVIQNFLINLLKGGFSDLISLFSGYELVVNVDKERVSNKIIPLNCKKAKKVLEVCLGFVFVPLGIFISKCTCTFKLPYGLVLFVAALLIGNKNQIIKKIFSVKYSEINGYNVNIMLPTNNFFDILKNRLGLSDIFKKTIYIDSELLIREKVIKKYVIEHEKAHIENMSKGFKFRVFLSDFFFLVTIISIFILDKKIGGNAYLAPFIVYVGVSVLFLPKYKKREFDADLKASEYIGANNCIEALNLLKENSKNYPIGFFTPSIDERINYLKNYV